MKVFVFIYFLNTHLVFLDPLRSLIMSDVIQVAKVDNIWLVTIFYLNTDPIGAVPEYAPDRASLDKWCASAKALAESNLKMITFSYDVFADSQGEINLNLKIYLKVFKIQKSLNSTLHAFNSGDSTTTTHSTHPSRAARPFGMGSR